MYKQAMEDEALGILRKVGALQHHSHFVLNSQRHSADFVQKEVLLAHLAPTRRIAEMMAEPYRDNRIDVVLAPAVAGQILGREVATCLEHMTGCSILSVFADKDGDDFVIKRGYDLFLRGKRVLVVEDVTTTQASVKKVLLRAVSVGAKIVGTRVMWNRGGPVTDIPDFSALINLKLPSFTEEECRLHGPCSRGVPIRTDLGHGNAYLDRLRAGEVR